MNPTRLHLFQAFGIELEYMIVHNDTLAVMPITDELFFKISQSYSGNIEFEKITWSNELVLHVLELKCTHPTKDLVSLQNDFVVHINKVNTELEYFNAKLLPTAAHPWMKPTRETHLWPHDNGAVYDRYNLMFNCKGHGWSNLQSTHINLPFYDDQEFAQLHAAVRLLLPVLPALAASSPILDGKSTGYLDKRLGYYQKNQKLIPSITGMVIPERAFSKRQYLKMIYNKIARDIRHFNKDYILDPIWMNSRGAIARFDRGSIEIRILDIQECPKADLAIATLVICVLKYLISEQSMSLHEQQAWEAGPLHEIFSQCIKYGENTVVNNRDYISVFGITSTEIKASELWAAIYDKMETAYPEEIAPFADTLEFILTHGSLATRILKAVGGIYTQENLRLVYHELSDCLAGNEMFNVCIGWKS